MRQRVFTLGSAALTLALMVSGCELEPVEPLPPLTWYRTCGDPVCRGETNTGTLPKCAGEAAGSACSAEGAMCDLADGCNRRLLCTTKDPAVVCPISRRSKKMDIHYLSENERAKLASELRAMKLATYRYATRGASAPRRLGLLEEGATAIDAERDMMDLYGYLSMTVATLQEQQQQLESLRREVAELR